MTIPSSTEPGAVTAPGSATMPGTDDAVTPSRPRALAATAFVLAAGLVLAGCGGAGGDSPGTPTGEPSETVTADETTAEEPTTDDGEDTPLEQIAVEEVRTVLQRNVDLGEEEYAASEGNVSDEDARTALRAELDAAIALLEEIDTYDELEPAREANKTLPAAIDAVTEVRTDTPTE